jgi:ABC-type metal ion transport system substrate-binding protein
MKCYNDSNMLHPTPIDISANPELLRIAEEVAATKTPRELKRDNQTVAVIMPASKASAPKKRRVKTKADYEAFKSAAGSWKGLIDVEQFKKDIYESRKISTRPPVKL